MIRKRTLVDVLLVAVLLGMMPLFSLAAPGPSQSAQEGTNLLKNPGFEGITCDPDSDPGWCNGNWTHTTHSGSVHGNIFTPQGWVTWWREGGGYGQPEVKVIPKVDPYVGPPARIRSGNYATLFFTFDRNHDGGFYQVVTGLEPGATVKFSAYAHGWSCDRDDTPYSCGDPWTQVFQVGIEPNGAADPFSPNVVWSQQEQSPDEYSLIGPVTAQVGAGGSVTVILRSKTKWPVKHLDSYWDDARLVTTSPGQPPTSTPQPPPPTATAGPSPTPQPTATPRPDGAIVHVVEEGDTLFGIALTYGVTVDQLRELNAGSLGPNDLLSIGQELVISTSGEAPTPTPLPELPTSTPEPTVAASPEPAGASVCVRAFHDRNGDTFQDEDTEELLPNAEFTVADASGVVTQYTTDGVSEPYCFPDLEPGSYRVIQNPPPGYEASGLPEQNVALAEGTSFDFQFGNVRSEGEAGESPDETAQPTPTTEGSSGSEESSTFSRVLAIVARVAGILVLILAAAIAVLFVLTRRRRY